MKALIVLVLIILLSGSLFAQDQAPIIYIFDASGSMWGKIGDNAKIDIAVSVIKESVGKLPDEQRVGLVAYGHRTKDDCKDVEFLVDAENGKKESVISSLEKIKPSGMTPLSFSASQVIEYLKSTKKKATIILVTDGMESCGGNICDVVKAAKGEGIDFRLHIIGFGLKQDETEQLRCAALEGNGNYFDAADAAQLAKVLDEATGNTIDKQAGNVSVYATKNGAPIDALVEAYLPGAASFLKSARTYSDTALFYLPPGTYELLIKPLQGSDVTPIKISNVESLEDKVVHRTVSFDGGKLSVTTKNNGEGWDAVVRVISPSTGKAVSSGRTYGKTDLHDVDPGVYNIELTAMKIDGSQSKVLLENFEVKSGEANSLEHNFQSGIVNVGAKSSAGLMDATIQIKEVSTGKVVASGRTYESSSSNPGKFILTPGTYELTLKGVGKNTDKKNTSSFEITPGGTVDQLITF